MGQDLSDIPGKQAEDLVFDRREMKLRAVKLRCAGGIVDLQLAVFKDTFLLFGRRQILLPALYGADARQHLLH